MTPLQKQRSCRALGIARGAEFAALEGIEDTIRGKETVAALVFRDNACGMASDFDDVGVGHDGLFAGLAGAPVLRCELIDLQTDQRQAPVAADRSFTATANLN